MSTSISSVNNNYNASLTRRVADDPAGSAIAQKHQSQVNGYKQGARNGEDGISLIKTADAALSNITDSLQRIRELSVKAASSAIYSDSDRQGMQKEIDQLKEHITSVAKDTQFNTKHLLDGSMADLYLALNPQGGGLSIKTEDMTLENLGIKDYSVTGKFDIRTIDDAISKVDGARASLGAQNNAVEFSVSVSNVSAENMTSSVSQIEDIDVEEYVTEQKKGQVMQQYNYFVQGQQMQQQQNMISKMLGMPVN
ncbi:MAG: flagellin [Lachnospiraceae bacterium]|nr:flagellin [Lachnospiraceae bacterium]